MEAFGLFKFWQNTTDATTTIGKIIPSATSAKSRTDNELCNQAVEMGMNEVESDDEESFFDLVLTTPFCNDNNSTDSPQKRENGAVKSPKDSFFNGKVFPLELNSKPQTSTLLRSSVPKFQIFTFGFKKSESEKTERKDTPTPTPKHQRQHKSSYGEESKGFTAKCKVEDVHIVSHLTRDNCLRSKLLKERSQETSAGDSSRWLTKDLAHKLIKPLYVGISKRYNGKNIISDGLSTVTPLSSLGTVSVCSPKDQTKEKQQNRANRFRLDRKNIVKNPSSAAVGATQSSARRDDILLYTDGIQSAILHCKSSYTSSKDCSSLSESNPSRESPINYPNKSSELKKRSSV